jgi:ribose-phosphate pyrophosphokinase
MPNGLQIFGGRANPKLTNDICIAMEHKNGQREIKQFADGEIWMQYTDNIRGSDVFIVQPTCAPVNDNLMELMLMINAAKLASAKRVQVVLPYFGYARQDRKDRPRTPLSAKVVASMLGSQRIKRVLTMDLHSAPIQGFFDIPVDHLYALPVFIDYIKQNFELSNLTIVSPDAGGTTRARMLAMKLGLPLAILDKFREAANVAEVMNIIGDVKGRNCLMIDDMIDTAGTLVKGAKALMNMGGARSVDAIATHGILSYDKKEDISALDKIENSVIRTVTVTDTIPQEENLGRILRNNQGDAIRTTKKLKVLSVAPLFAKAIQAVHNNDSVSGLFV